MIPSTVLLVFLSVFLEESSSSRILAVFPTVSKSHFDFFQPLLEELFFRGHHVTVISSFPRQPPTDNYTDISLKNFKKVFINQVTFNMLPNVPSGFLDSLTFLHGEIFDFENTFLHPDVKTLIDSGQEFDLVITEAWNSDLFLVFGHHFHAPVILMSSCSILPWWNPIFANPDNPSYIPTSFFGIFGDLDFWSRLENTYQVLVSKFVFDFFYEPVSGRIARKVFGDSLPPLRTLAQDSALLLVNTHHSLHGARPLTPRVVEVGGLHVKENKPLAKELQKWMDESEHGVVYFSFGSMLRGATLPADKVESFLRVFGALKQRVLWKWEDDTLQNLPPNVKVMKWLPQRDVLAHPKVRVFLSHGGLLGTTEAIVSAVPILGIPMYGDQPNNVAALVERGVAVHLDYNNISVASLSYALDALLHDPSYAESAKQLAKQFLDRPQSPLDTAVYWVEYVLRHGGAPHLRSAAVHLAWYQYYLLDVAALCLLALAATLTTLYYLTTACCSLLRSTSNTKLKAN